MALLDMLLQRARWWWMLRTMDEQQLAAAYRDAARNAAQRAEKEFGDTYDDDTRNG